MVGLTIPTTPRQLENDMTFPSPFRQTVRRRLNALVHGKGIDPAARARHILARGGRQACGVAFSAR
jgi:hypothetical protein